MKTIAILCLCLLAVVQSKPPYLGYQDSIGQYSFGYSGPSSARSEYLGSDGVTRGTYSYVDHNGLIQTAEYEAGSGLGFQVRATNLPQAPLPTLEVMLARDRHLKLMNEARRRDEVEGEVTMTATNDGSASIEGRNAAVTTIEGKGVVADRREDTGSMADSKKEAVGSGDRIESRNNAASMMSETEPQDGKTTLIKSTLPLAISPVSQSEINTNMMISGQSMESQSKIAPISEANVGQARPIVVTGLPQPVDYTPEVMAARDAHFKAYEAAAKLAAVEPDTIEDNKLANNPDVGYPTTLTTKLRVTETSEDKRIVGAETALPIVDVGKILDNAVGNVQSNEKLKSVDFLKSYSGLTPASTSLRIMDVRLPSLNEFQQTKLKAEAYNTPIEISHIAPTHGFQSQPPFFGSSTFYVYL